MKNLFYKTEKPVNHNAKRLSPNNICGICGRAGNRPAAVSLKGGRNIE